MKLVIEAMIDAECDYMLRNCLGDPEKQHNIKWGRAVIERVEAKERESAQAVHDRMLALRNAETPDYDWVGR